MQFRIADTFTDSLAKLTGDEQKAVKRRVRVGGRSSRAVSPASEGRLTAYAHKRPERIAEPEHRGREPQQADAVPHDAHPANGFLG